MPYITVPTKDSHPRPQQPPSRFSLPVVGTRCLTTSPRLPRGHPTRTQSWTARSTPEVTSVAGRAFGSVCRHPGSRLALYPAWLNHIKQLKGGVSCSAEEAMASDIKGVGPHPTGSLSSELAAPVRHRHGDGVTPGTQSILPRGGILRRTYSPNGL